MAKKKNFFYNTSNTGTKVPININDTKVSKQKKKNIHNNIFNKKNSSFDEEDSQKIFYSKNQKTEANSNKELESNINNIENSNNINFKYESKTKKRKRNYWKNKYKSQNKSKNYTKELSPKDLDLKKETSTNNVNNEISALEQKNINLEIEKETALYIQEEKIRQDRLTILRNTFLYNFYKTSRLITNDKPLTEFNKKKNFLDTQKELNLNFKNKADFIKKSLNSNSNVFSTIIFNQIYRKITSFLSANNREIQEGSYEKLKKNFLKQYKNHCFKNLVIDQYSKLFYNRIISIFRLQERIRSLKIKNKAYTDTKNLSKSQLISLQEKQNKIFDSFEKQMLKIKDSNTKIANEENVTSNDFTFKKVKKSILKKNKKLIYKRIQTLKTFFKDDFSLASSEAYDLNNLYSRELKYSITKINSKLFKHSNRFFIPGYQTYRNIPNKNVETLPQYIITVKITPNNTMLTLTDKKGNVLIKMSAGKIKLNSSKKNYKSICHLVITAFFTEVKKTSIKKKVLVKLIVPKNLKKKVLRRVKYYAQRHRKSVIEHVRLLPFNGCRPPKSRRKKRKGLRLFKSKI
jgi:small subunit ribosomal protein S11